MYGGSGKVGVGFRRPTVEVLAMFSDVGTEPFGLGLRNHTVEDADAEYPSAPEPSAPRSRQDPVSGDTREDARRTAIERQIAGIELTDDVRNILRGLDRMGWSPEHIGEAIRLYRKMDAATYFALFEKARTINANKLQLPDFFNLFKKLVTSPPRRSYYERYRED